MRRHWGATKAGALALLFLAVDLAFLVANAPKLATGGWIPILLAALLLVFMTTWHRGNQAVRRRLHALAVPMETLFDQMDALGVVRVPGAAVFLTRQDQGAPSMLTHYLLHTRSLHASILLLHVHVERVPRVADADSLRIEILPRGFVRVTAAYGFMQVPDVRQLLRRIEDEGLPVIAAETTVFLGHSTVVAGKGRRSPRWRVALFNLLNRNAQPAPVHFRLPAKQVVELGVRIEL